MSLFSQLNTKPFCWKYKFMFLVKKNYFNPNVIWLTRVNFSSSFTSNFFGDLTDTTSYFLPNRSQSTRSFLGTGRWWPRGLVTPSGSTSCPRSPGRYWRTRGGISRPRFESSSSFQRLWRKIRGSRWPEICQLEFVTAWIGRQEMCDIIYSGYFKSNARHREV